MVTLLQVVLHLRHAILMAEAAYIGEVCYGRHLLLVPASDCNAMS